MEKWKHLLAFGIDCPHILWCSKYTRWTYTNTINVCSTLSIVSLLLIIIFSILLYQIKLLNFGKCYITFGKGFILTITKVILVIRARLLIPVEPPFMRRPLHGQTLINGSMVNFGVEAGSREGVREALTAERWSVEPSF